MFLHCLSGLSSLCFSSKPVFRLSRNSIKILVHMLPCLKALWMEQPKIRSCSVFTGFLERLGVRQRLISRYARLAACRAFRSAVWCHIRILPWAAQQKKCYVNLRCCSRATVVPEVHFLVFTLPMQCLCMKCLSSAGLLCKNKGLGSTR